jgi:hypothetical protein
MHIFQRIALLAALSALGLSGCAEQQPRNACSFQVTSGRNGVSGYSAKYTLKSVEGTACKAFLGVDQPGESSGEIIGIGLFGLQGDSLALKPYSASVADSGQGIAIGGIVVDPTVSDACTAATLAPATYVTGDLSWVAPDPLPDPAPTAPGVEVSYTFSNVRFIQAANIPGTQMTGQLLFSVSPLEAGNGAGNCTAAIEVSAVWYSGAWARCETSEECTPAVLGVPGKDGDYLCQDLIALQADYVPVLDEAGQIAVDENGEEIWEPKTGRRCVPNRALPIDAVPFDD